MKHRTWLRLNTAADRNMDDGLKKVYEKEEKRRMQQQEAEEPLFKDIDPISGTPRKKKSRIDVIGQNGNDGEHYEHLPNGRWNWYGEGEEKKPMPKITGRNPETDCSELHDDLPSAAEDCARTRGNYEI